MIQGAKISLQSDGVKYVEIPQGWKRILENGSVQYLSPNSSLLRSYENVIEYLKKDGTCKCGLDCPFHVHRIFNFDISVQNKESNDVLVKSENHSSSCKLAESNWLKNPDGAVLQRNQTAKQAVKKPAQFSLDGSLQKKVVNRSRSKLSDGPKAKRPRKVTSPLSDVPSPPPIPISSPVQNVPNNLGALNQGPLPSFASIVSSSKFFNPGPNRGPLQPIGSLPFQGNKFAFPRILNVDTSKSVTTVGSNAVTTAYTATTMVTTIKPSVPKISIPKHNSMANSTVAQNNATSINSTHTSHSDMKPIKEDTSSGNLLQSAGNSSSSGSVLPTVVRKTVPLVKTISSSTITNNKAVIMPIINTPTLPSVFAPLDGVDVKSKPPPKAKTRSRPSRAKKPKADPKLDDKLIKMAGNSLVMSTGYPVASSWPVSGVTGTHMPYQISNTTVVSSNNQLVSSLQTDTSTRLNASQSSSVYTTSGLTHGQLMKTSTPSAVSSVNHAAGSTTSIATTTSTYSVVATPRIQAPPGMMYVAAAPGVGMFSPAYQYAATAPQLQITQPSVSQQPKTSSSTATATSTTSHSTTKQATETSQGQISFHVPGIQYVQGANQMFPISQQGFGQYKAPYQVQYPSTGNAMAFITPNGAKAYHGLQTVGQFAYPNPYMFGIVMPTTTNQPSTTATTPSSPGTPTTAATSLNMVQPQGIQNPAVAAAFESFVPIAPAAGGTAPRFAQTLAHLANAYNAYPQAGIVQGANQLQLAYQMMQMNAQQAVNLGGLGASDPKCQVTAKSSDSSKDKSKTTSPLSASPSTPSAQDHEDHQDTTASHCSSTYHGSSNQHGSSSEPGHEKQGKTMSESNNESIEHCKGNDIKTARLESNVIGSPKSSKTYATANGPTDHSISPSKNSDLSAQGPENSTKLNNINPVRTEQSTHCFTDGKATSHTKQEEYPKGRTMAAVESPTKLNDISKHIKQTNVTSKVNYYETNPLLGMKRSCEAIEVYKEPPESEQDRDDDYSSIEGSPDGNDDASEPLNLRQGVSVEDPSRDGKQTQIVGKGLLHNGGFETDLNEQDPMLSEAYQPNMYGEQTMPNRLHFDIGDVVWAQARGLPSWPGKIVDENKIGKGKPDEGKKWVMWFGDHTFSQVEVERLKSLNEGIRSLDDKTRKKKYRAKKARISLEQAITEAVDELETRDQMRSKQELRSFSEQTTVVRRYEQRQPPHRNTKKRTSKRGYNPPKLYRSLINHKKHSVYQYYTDSPTRDVHRYFKRKAKNYQSYKQKAMLSHRNIKHRKMKETTLMKKDRADLYCGSGWQEKYARLHNRIVRSSDQQRYLVYTCPGTQQGCCGYGNRLRALVSIFFLAVLTDRAFLIDWLAPEPIENHLIPRNVQWNYSAPLDVCEGPDFRNHYWGTASAEKKRAEGWIIQDSHHFKNWFTTTNMSQYFDQPVEKITTIWYFAEGGIDSNKYLMRRAHQLGITPLLSKANMHSLIRCAFDFLFKPSNLVESHLNEWRNLLHNSNGPKIGIHIRTGDKQFNYFAQEDERSLNLKNASKLSQFFQCAKNIEQTVFKNANNSQWFLASDHLKVKQFATKHFSGKVITTNLTIQHLDILYNMTQSNQTLECNFTTGVNGSAFCYNIVPFNKTIFCANRTKLFGTNITSTANNTRSFTAGIVAMLVDHILLSECDFLVVCDSSFSSTAIGLGMKTKDYFVFGDKDCMNLDKRKAMKKMKFFRRKRSPGKN